MDDASARVSSPALRALRATLPFAWFLALAFAFTANAWGDPTHSWPGGAGDSYKFMGFLSWTPHALGQLHNPLHMTAIDYPAGVNLAWETPVPLGGALMWPITALLGPVAAFNVFILLSLTLDGWCTYLWLRRHVRSGWAAGLAAVIVAAGPWAGLHVSQLNLVSYWPIPLMFMATESLVRGSWPRLRAGVVLGALLAVQLYLAEELAVIAVIALAVALVIVALASASYMKRAWSGVVVSGAAAVVVFAVLAAPMLLFQFRGPGVVRGLIHPSGFYVTDLQNFVIPTSVTWAWQHSWTQAQTASWTGIAEAGSYIGIPLLLVALYVVIRWWREPLVRVVAVTSLSAAILSLGPHLHIGGVDTGFRLPGAIFNHLPLLENLLPVRLSLITDFGLAFLLALALDRTLLRRPPQRPHVTAVAALGILGVVSFVSVIPVPASSTTIPVYFQPGGGAGRLPAGTVALVAPYIDEGVTTPVVMLWQAESTFRFNLIDGLAITSDPNGQPTFVLHKPISVAFDEIQLRGRAPIETDAARRLWLSSLRSDGVDIIIVGPMQHRDLAVAFVEWLTGRAPHDTEGVSVWSGLLHG